MIDNVIDLSHNNPAVDFAQVKQAGGMTGVIHKATEGLTYPDPDYAGRRTQALAAGLLWGAYHFGHYEQGLAQDGLAQAEFFLATVKPQPTDLLVLDFETSGKMTTAQAEAFVQHVNEQTGRYPGLYTSTNYLKQQGATTSSILHNCWLWLSEFNPSISEPVSPPNWPLPWTMWQYTQTGTVAGVEGPCDRDRFNGEADGLHRLWIETKPAATTPA